MRLIAVLPILLSLALSSLAQDVGAQLTDRHKEWLEEEVAYIISDKERETFLKLDSEELRNQFVEMFWKQRDPTPATAYNEYKEEHYRRLSYANTWFGSRKEENGWRSDRGRIYILFGEPQEKVRFTGENDIRDCEIWFYDAQGQLEAIPFFRLIFYQRSFGQDYVLYSPTHDGPQELAMMIAPTRQQALDYLWERAGQQLWEAAQSYIPSEPLGGGWSAESEILLAKIENLNNTLVDDTWAESFLVTRGRVSTRLSFKNLPMTVMTRTLFNLRKEAFYHAAFEIQPEHLIVGEVNGNFYSVFDIRTFVEDLESGQEILAKSDHWEARFPEKDGAPMARPIAFEQAFPLVPGRYKILWIIDDLINETFTFRQKEVEIPAPGRSKPLLTEPLLAARYESLDRSRAGEVNPFRIFNIQYAPDFSNDFNRGDNLSVFFQYLFPTGESRPDDGVRFSIELKRPLGPQTEPIIYEHQVPAERLTEDGIVFVHRQIPVVDLSPGRYNLTVRAFVGETLVAESSEVQLSYRGEEVLVRPKPDVLPVEPRLMTVDYVLERSRQFEARGEKEEALAELKAALESMGEDTLLQERIKELQRP